MSQRPLRVVSWNVNCGVFADETEAVDAVPYIADALQRLEPDVVALQEVRSMAGGEPDAGRIAALCGLPYFAVHWLSESHLVDGAGLNLALLSRYPIRNQRAVNLPNPRLSLPGSGPVRTSHDKGLLHTTLDAPWGTVGVVCGHMLPFHKFGRQPAEPEFAGIWRALVDFLKPVAAEPSIVCLDLNTSELASLVPELVVGRSFRGLLQMPTRPSGERHDQILASHHWRGGAKALPSRFDHHLCLADVFGRREAGPLDEQYSDSLAPRTAILHLSDLHFGTGSFEDDRTRTSIRFLTRRTRRDRFMEVLSALAAPPDYVIVTGDLTIAGSQSGYDSFVEAVDELIRMGKLPGRSSFCIVPGNHDVVRLGLDAGLLERQRWEPFIAAVGGEATRPWLPANDLPEAEMLRLVDGRMGPDAQRWGGAGTAAGDGRPVPFLFDRHRRLLLYCFNSASIAGSTIDLEPDEQQAFERLRGRKGRKDSDLALVLRALGRELSVDPARVDDRELKLFAEIVRRLRDRAPTEFERALKIAVLHHHVNAVLLEEIDKFDFISNAGRLKKSLREAGFQMVLHGHKHWPRVVRDDALPDEDPRWVVSGGTIGGGTPATVAPGFGILEYDPAERRVIVRRVAITETEEVGEALGHGESQVVSLDRRERDRRDETKLRLEDLFAATERSLLSFVRTEEGDCRQRMGWSHGLEESRVTTLATAFGLRILRLVRARSGRAREVARECLETLVVLRNQDGGWRPSSQTGVASYVEPTAFVIGALNDWCHPLTGEVKGAIETAFAGDETCRRHVYSLAVAAAAVAETDPSSRALRQLTDSLEKAAFQDEQGRPIWWSAMSLTGADGSHVPSGSRGSVPHTAHAMLALIAIYRSRDRAHKVSEDFCAAREWLLNQSDWSDTTEDIYRPLGDGRYDKLVVKHFTEAWAVRAVLESGGSPEHPRVWAAIRQLLDSHHGGIWNWGKVERPIWATLDALRALQAFAWAAASV